MTEPATNADGGSTTGPDGPDGPRARGRARKAVTNPTTGRETAAAYVSIIGVAPEDAWASALARKGIPLGKADLTGNHTTQCPAHDDRVSSLRWAATADGRVLIKCLAGCETRDVVVAVGLGMWALAPVGVEYLWCGTAAEGLADEVVAAHVREYKLAEGNKFSWKHVGEDGEWVPSRGEAELEVLWRGPALREWAARGGDELWLVEGEKDAYLAELSFEAEVTKRNPGPPPRIATTGAGGAAQDVEAVANAVADLCAGRPVRVVVVGDNDTAGRKRVAKVVAAIGPSVIAGGGAVEILYPPESVRDLGAAIDRYGPTKWRERMVPGSVEDGDLESDDPYGEFCVQNGMLAHGTPPDSEHPVLCHVLRKRGKAGAGAGGGEGEEGSGESVVLSPVLVVAPKVVEVEVDPEGTHAAWTLEWAEVETGEIRRFRIPAEAVASVQNWAGRVVVPTGGALALQSGHGVAGMVAWLRWHSARLTPVMVRRVCGWNQHNREWHFAGYEGPIVGTGQAFRPDKTRELWRYGLGAPEDGTGENPGEAHAAALIAELVWFRRPEESCVLLAALAANTVRPVADQVAGMVRVVSVYGLSNTGKTTYLRLALRAFGSLGYGQSNTTVAAFGRDVAHGSGPYWLDDEAGPHMEDILSAIRGAATGGGRVRAKADTDGATVEQKSEALIVISAEAEARGEEKAMRDRMVSVQFLERAQDRMSHWDAERPQWDDMVRLGAGDPHDHELLTDYSGWVVRGLWAATKGVSWDSRVGAATGAREARVGRFLRVGAAVLSDWLRTWGHTEEADLISEVVSLVAREREETSRTIAYAGLDTYAATELLPRALSDRSATLVYQLTPPQQRQYDLGEVTAGRLITWAHEAMALGEHRPSAYPAVRILRHTLTGEPATIAVAVRADRLYLWATSDNGRRAGLSGDMRNVGRNAIVEQVAALCSCDAEGKPRRHTAQIPDGTRAEYRALRADVVGVVLGAMPTGSPTVGLPQGSEQGEGSVASEASE